MLLALNFFAEGGIIQKIKNVWSYKPIILFFGLFLLHILGLCWSSDIDYALRDIQIKIPLFALSIILGASKKLSTKHFEWVLLFFIATSIASSVVGSVIYFILSNPGDDYRLMSPYMSHIRLSLMLGVAIFSSLYLGYKSVQWSRFKGWFIGIGMWLFVYLFMLRAMSGIVAVLAASFVLLWVISSKSKWRLARFGKWSMVLIIFISVGYIYSQVKEFYAIEPISLKTADSKSKSGEDYQFDLNLAMLENGRYIYSYIAINELRTEWNKVSKLDFGGQDLKDQNLKSTLIRYMTSKNLRKDKEGVQALTHLDIWAIENGIANERFLSGKSLNTMVYRYIWEVHNYLQGFNPQGNSLAQRFLFWKNGYQIFQDNWLYGVGTGDVQIAFNDQYNQMPYVIIDKYRLRAHNQYLTIAISFGVLGLVYFLITLFSGFWVLPNAKSYLFIGTFIILMVSMLDEDTLETQFGVTYAVFFYFLFLFHQPIIENSSTTNN